MMQVEQIDRDAAETLFKDVLGNVSSYGEWGYTSYREAAERSMAQAFARHRHQARAEVVGKIVAWLRDNITPHNDIDEWADEIEAKFGGRDET